MQNSVMVTVLMFVYNQKDYLRQAIDSVLNQKTNFDYEVIIHDDASTDGSAEIIREYSIRFPNRILPILQKENQMSQGIAVVDKFLMPRVKGKYIAFCEGDDYWLSEQKLQIQVDFLEQHQEYATVTHNCRVVDENGITLAPVEKFYPFSRPYCYTLKDLILEERMPGQTASVMYRHEVQTKMTDAQRNAYQNIRYAVGDRRRTLLLLLNSPVYCMPQELSAYRYVVNNGGNWNSYARKRNLAGSYFVQEMDFRRFAEEQFQTKLKNDYVLFGTGISAYLRFLKSHGAEQSIKEQNYRQWKKVRGEFKTFAGFVIYMCRLFPRAIYVRYKRKHNF